MSEFKSYTGQEFFDLKFPPRTFLIDKFMKEKDSIIIVGEAKAGKSVLVFQLITSLTSAHPFLDKYGVSRSCKVSYLQLEGELADSQDRFNRMIGSVDFDKDLFHIKFSEPLQLQDEAKTKLLIAEIEQYHKPDVIIIDPIYFAMTGSLSDDDIVRQFMGNVRIMKDHFGCAIILVHHCHKIKLDPKGNIVYEGDNAMFGSAFFSAFVDHIFLFRYDKKNETRTLSCDTQRAGNIIKDLKLKLVEPNPLYFEVIENLPSNWGRIYDYIKIHQNGTGFSQSQISEALSIERHNFYRSVKQPITDKILLKEKIGKEVFYTLKNV